MKTRQTPIITFAALALISAALPAAASTISITSTIPAGGNVHGSASSQVALKDSAGVTLPAGMRLRVGFFVGYTSALDETLRAPGGVFTLMDAGSPNQFVALGEPPLMTGYGDDSTATNVTKVISGSLRWSASIPNVTYTGASVNNTDDNTIATGGPARGTHLFLLVYNTGSLNPDIHAPGFEYGLFSDASWVIPEFGTANTALNAAIIDQDSEVYYGKLGNSLHTAPFVPEPSATMFSLFTGLGLMLRRRRK